MNNTPTTNERWKALCLSGKSWYQIAEELDILKNKYANIETTALSLMMENKTVTEQRDRLAEKLRLIADGTSCRECGGEDQALFARQALQSMICDALQSLTPNEQGHARLPVAETQPSPKASNG